MADLHSKYLFIASMDVDPTARRFSTTSTTPSIARCSTRFPASAVTRYETQRLVMAMGGEVREIEIPGTPRHHAVYQLDSPEILTSSEWAAAVDAGRWPEQVRPTPTTGATCC